MIFLFYDWCIKKIYYMETLKTYLNKETLLRWSTVGWVLSALVTFMMLVAFVIINAKYNDAFGIGSYGSCGLFS